MECSQREAGIEEADLSKLSIHDDESNFYHGPLNESYYLVQCPFTWIDEISHSKMEEIISESCNVVVGDPKEWNEFCLNIYYAFCHAKLGNMGKAFNYVDECSDLLTKKSEDEFFKEISDGMSHALNSVRAHINFINGDPVEADEMIAKVVPMQDLARPCQAALKGIYATVSHEFGLRPKDKYLETFKEAMELDPDEKGSRRGIWYYNVGKLIGQIRRLKYRTQTPSEEELRYLEKAIKINPFPVYLATLAESKREAARYGWNDMKSHTLYREAKKLLIEAYQKDQANASTLRRCGKGLMNLPPEFQDIPLARECLEKAIKLDPGNSPALQALGSLEERHNGNLLNAIHYYQLAVQHGSVISATSEIRLRFKMNRKYDPIEYCDQLIKKDIRNEVKASLHVTKGEFLLYERKNLLDAAKEFEKAHNLAPGSDSLKKHWKVFLGKNREGGKPSINVYMCLKKAIITGRSAQVSDVDQLFLDGLLKVCLKYA